MNTITTEQNTEKQLKRLAAQRQLYATAKKVFGWQIFLSSVGVTAAFMVILITPSLKVYAALWGLIVVLIDLLVLGPWQKRLQTSAASIQEVFDCEVLSLPWSNLKAGKHPDPELVSEQSAKYSKWAHTMPPLNNWYSIEVEKIPLTIARIACQRSNCWWDSKQRKRYAVSLIIVEVGIVLMAVVLGIYQGFTISDFILIILAPFAPALVLGIKQYKEQIEAASRLDKLKEHAEKHWDDALNGKSEKQLTKAARELQDEILESRKRNPLVFDWVFKLLRRSYEAQMNMSTAELVAEAELKIKRKQKASDKRVV